MCVRARVCVLSLFCLQFALLHFVAVSRQFGTRALQSAAQRAPGSVSLCVLLPCEETCISVCVAVCFVG